MPTRRLATLTRMSAPATPPRRQNHYVLSSVLRGVASPLNFVWRPTLSNRGSLQSWTLMNASKTLFSRWLFGTHMVTSSWNSPPVPTLNTSSRWVTNSRRLLHSLSLAPSCVRPTGPKSCFPMLLLVLSRLLETIQSSHLRDFSMSSRTLTATSLTLSSCSICHGSRLLPPSALPSPLSPSPLRTLTARDFRSSSRLPSSCLGPASTLTNGTPSLFFAAA